ncbi:MAG: CbiX/SirB N-terminal domain-containing protein [Kiloniellaceae bacterium]
MAPATEPRSALLVAHGSPSAPEGPQRAIGELADAVAALLPGWSVAGATLAARGALDAALSALWHPVPLIFPVFMSDGWFVRVKLPERVGRVRGEAFQMVRPLGLDPALHALCLDCALDAIAGAGWRPERTTLLLAAHGSPTDPRPRTAVVEVVRTLTSADVFGAVRAGFLDEAPYLADAARIEGPAVCLPFFAGCAGHVETDIPEALLMAGFDGLLLDAIGQHAGVAAIIAAALARQAGRWAA